MPLEMRVGANADLDEGVTWLASPDTGTTLRLEAKHLPVGDTFRHVEIELPALGHGDALAGAEHCFHEVHVQGVAHILAAQAEPGAWTARSSLAEQVREDIAESELGPTRTATPGPSVLVGAAGLARGIDLAAVIGLLARWIAQDLVGRAHALESFVRADVAGIEVRMQLLGQLAVCAADLVFRRRPCQTKYGVGVFGHVAVRVSGHSQIISTSHSSLWPNFVKRAPSIGLAQICDRQAKAPRARALTRYAHLSPGWD